MKTGRLGKDGSLSCILNEQVIWTNEDYNTLQAGGQIGLYWFPGITGETTILPESGFEIGGLQETLADTESGGDAGMVVPSNSGGQVLIKIEYYDNNLNPNSRLPPSRFTAIDVPPSGYQIWRDLKFTQIQIDAGDADPTADPDKDGWSNLLEYATSTTPLMPNISPLSLNRSDDSVFLEFDRIADPELRYRIEATPDLGTSPWPDVVFESSGADNVEELVSHPEAVGAGKRFFRLSVDSGL